MSIWIAHTALVSEQWGKSPRDVECVDALLEQPVDVVNVRAAGIVMLAHCEVVEFGNVQGIPIGVVLRAVIVAVTGVFRMPVRVTSVDLVCLPLRLDLVGTNPGDILPLVRVLHEDP